MATKKEKQEVIKKIDEDSLQTIVNPKNEEEKKRVLTSLHGKFILVKVGNDVQSASTEDIKQVAKDLNEILSEGKVECLLYVTHHMIEIEVF